MTVTLLLSLALLSLSACGKKGNPVPPESMIPGRISDLRAWPREGTVFLGWTIPNKNTNDSPLLDLMGFRVFRESRPVAGACETCPAQVQPVAEIEMEYPKGARVEGGKVLWQDTALQPGNEYAYIVVAYNLYGVPSAESNRVIVSWDVPPPPPTNVQTRGDDRSLEITWEFPPSPAAVGFNLYRRAEGGGFGFYPVNPSPVMENRVVDVGLENGKKYFYEVRAARSFRGTFIEGPPSAEAAGVPEKVTPPLPPAGLFGVFQEGGVALRWDESREKDVAGYNVYRREDGQEAFRKINGAPVKEAYYLDTTAEPKKTYVYRVKTVDIYGKESEFSNETEVPIRE
ncbi:MAG TPA: hypothetical protein VLS90_00670 [Thermodesulfobacteriota bacterium]|nr:hypothetical protein [Thermodesulfobacteriota bacterium]